MKIRTIKLINLGIMVIPSNLAVYEQEDDQHAYPMGIDEYQAEIIVISLVFCSIFCVSCYVMHYSTSVLFVFRAGPVQLRGQFSSHVQLNTRNVSSGLQKA